MPLKYKPFTDPMDDKRRKIHPDEHEVIIQKYKEGHSQRSLAKSYGVSRTLIGIIVNPERAAAVKERIKENWPKYYDREKLTKATRALRKRKRAMGLCTPLHTSA